MCLNKREILKCMKQATVYGIRLDGERVLLTDSETINREIMGKVEEKKEMQTTFYFGYYWNNKRERKKKSLIILMKFRQTLPIIILIITVIIKIIKRMEKIKTIIITKITTDRMKKNMYPMGHKPHWIS